MANLKLYADGALLAELPLEVGAGYSVGRSPGSRILIDRPSVSVNHCRFWSEDSRWWVEDIGSAGGTFVNEIRIGQARALTAGDQVRVGDVTILFHVVGSRMNSTPLSLADKEATPGFVEEKDPHGFPVYSNVGPAEEPPPPKPRVFVLVLEGLRPAAVTLDKDITVIGSGEHCDLRIDGLFVRREQAVVLKDHTGWRIIGQGGLRSLRVNGEKVLESYVVPGDEIVLAGHRLSLKSL